ncbi:MAG: hypothetical protein V7K27_18140 [Nostoc sp.]|uniref:hypothetical protein n=1 Tax=Nostoc sp. TaxID=1180 RepID=UPI002FFCA6F3
MINKSLTGHDIISAPYASHRRIERRHTFIEQNSGVRSQNSEGILTEKADE